MNWLDIIIIIYLVISVITGVAQGLIKSALSLIGIIVGLVLAANFYQQFANTILGFISNRDVAQIIGFILILVIVIAIAAIIALVLRSAIQAIMLGFIDRIGGGIFGLFMGALTVGGILAIIVKLTGSNIITQSALAGFLLDKFPIVLGLLPSQFNSVKDFFK